MRSAKVLSPLLLCAGLGLAASAHAENEGWYFIGSAGATSVNGESQSFLDDVAGLIIDASESTLDDSDTTFGLTAGFQVNRNFAAELAYVDLGESDYTASDANAPVSTVSFNSSAQGPTFSLLGMLPIGDRFSLYARAGIALMDSEGSARLTFDGNVVDSLSDSTTRSNGLYGLGGDFMFTNRFGVRLDWTRYADVGSDEVTLGEADVDTFTLGLRFQLR